MEAAENHGTEDSMSKTSLSHDERMCAHYVSDAESPHNCCCLSNKVSCCSVRRRLPDLNSILKYFHVSMDALLHKKLVVESAKTYPFHSTQLASKSPPHAYSQVDIWYAAYGSNLWLPRFQCYIDGGQVEGMTSPMEGSVDKSPIKGISWRVHPRRLFFGVEVDSCWGIGGVAFLHLQDNDSEKCHLCLYKISLQQFRDVLLQENLKSVDSGFEFESTWLNSLETKGFLEVFKHGWYGNVGYLGEKDGLPILTVTCCWSGLEEYVSGQLRRSPPSPRYRNVVVKGLVDGKQMSYDEAVLYIDDATTRPL